MFRSLGFIFFVVWLSGVCCIAEEEKSSSEVEQMMQFADGLFDRGFYDLAVPEYRKLLDNAPDSALAPQASYQLARACLKAGNNEACLKALKEFSESLDKGGFKVEVTVLKAELEEAAGNAEEAMTLYGEVAAGRAPVKVKEMALFRKARLLSASAKLKEATTIYRTLATKGVDSNYPYRAYSLYYLGYISQLDGKLEQAVAYYRKLVSSVAKDWAQLPDAYFNLGRLYFAQANYSKALKQFEVLLYRFPKYKNAADVIMKMILSYYEQGKYDDALSLITVKRKVLVSVKDQVAYIEGNCFFVLKKYDQALKVYAEVASNKQSSYAKLAQTQIVSVYIQQENFKLASEFSLPLASKIKVNEWQGREIFAFYTGYSAYKTGKVVEAITYLERALKLLSPEYDEHQQAELILAELYKGKGRLKDGLKLYQKAALKLKDPQLIRLAFACALESGDEKVVSDLYLVVKSESWSFVDDIVVAYARWLVRENKFDEAVAVLNYFLKRKKSRAASYMAGYVLFYQQKYKEAVVKLTAIAGVGNDDVSAAAQLYLGWSKIRLGHENSGGSIVGKVIHRESKSWPALDNWEWRELAGEMASCRFNEEALKIYQYLLTVAVGEERLKIVTGQVRVLQKLGRYKDAVSAMRKLIASEGMAASDKLIAKSLLGEAMLMAGSQGLAAILFQEALKSKPNGEMASRVFWGLAETYLLEKRYNDALRLATTCYIVHPSKRYSPKAMVVALRCFDAMNKFAEAKKVWSELKLKYPVEAQLEISKDNLSKSLKDKVSEAK